MGKKINLRNILHELYFICETSYWKIIREVAESEVKRVDFCKDKCRYGMIPALRHHFNLSEDVLIALTEKL